MNGGQGMGWLTRRARESGKQRRTCPFEFIAHVLEELLDSRLIQNLAFRTPTHKPNPNDTVSLSSIDTHDLDGLSFSDDPTPIYSLSHHLFVPGDQRASAMSGVSNLFFSRSAPAASNGNHDRDQAHAHENAHFRGATTTGDATPSSDDDRRDALLAHNTSASGSYVRVLDLGPLLNSHTSSHPQAITEFVAAKH
ncbi:hypothetical protein EV363DRAFT_1158353 [Boletus edulis]|nr:hypothetical protein EV363DRAFT_1158353 [Boletus edulis]